MEKKRGKKETCIPVVAFLETAHLKTQKNSKDRFKSFKTITVLNLITLLNPIALSTAKTLRSFGGSEWNRVKETKRKRKNTVIDFYLWKKPGYQLNA